MNQTQHLFLKVLNGEKVERPPVWMMRQAGRYLPEYIAIRNKYDFFTRVQTPELACEITLQPINIIGTDAAILFSDILVIPQAMGLDVVLEENKGPILPRTIKDKRDIDNLNIENITDRLDYVTKAIRLIKNELNNKVPLIGFAGAPFTILCYMVEGKGSKNFDKAKNFCFTQPVLAHELLQKITNVTIEYLISQVAAGADCVQIFDSWSGLLSPHDFNIFAMPYLEKITNELSQHCPVILFPKGSWYALPQIAFSQAKAVGIDWNVDAKTARNLTENKIVLQGNFDPSKLLMSKIEIKKEVYKMIKDFGTQKYIANLGHGILPNIPVENAKAFVEAVKEFKE